MRSEGKGGMSKDDGMSMRMREEEEGGMGIHSVVGRKVRKLRDTKEVRGRLVGARGAVRLTELRQTNCITSYHIICPMLRHTVFSANLYSTILYYTMHCVVRNKRQFISVELTAVHEAVTIPV
jgi:hypothetical protein